MTTLFDLSAFAACAALIAVAGTALVRAADRIALQTGLSRGWIGVGLLATVTSLPELSTSLSAVTIADAPDVALGDALGSCMFNVSLLVLIDALHRRPPLYAGVGAGHALSAAFGVALLGFVAVNLVLAGTRLAKGTPLSSAVSIPTILCLYLIALRSVFARERAVALRGDPPQARNGMPGDMRSAWRGFALASGAVLVAGSAMPFLASNLAGALSWRLGFVGTLLVATATSLPELVVTLSAVRLRAVDMAIGNLLGSNLFNVAIIAIADAAYPRGPMLAAVEASHVINAVAAIAMTTLAGIGCLFRPQSRVFGTLNWINAGIAVIHVASLALAFRSS